MPEFAADGFGRSDGLSYLWVYLDEAGILRMLSHVEGMGGFPGAPDTVVE